MVESHPGQQCGNCGADNTAGAVVCTACGVVLSAYATLAKESAADAGTTPNEPAMVEPAKTAFKPSRPISGGDWRSIFDRPAIGDSPLEAGSDALPTESLVPEGTRFAITDSPVADQPPPAPIAPRIEPRPTPAASAAPIASTSGATLTSASKTPAVGGQKPTSSRPGPESVVTDLPRHRVNPAVRKPAQAPMSVIYAGLALFLGGCVLTGILTAATDNSTAIGLSFLCTFPTGVILLVLGGVMLLNRREGRGAK